MNFINSTIAVVSDTHGFLPTIDPVDTLFICGDICPIYDHNPDFQQDWLEDEFTKWLNNVPANEIIGIGGNHDFALQLFEGLGHSLPWTYLENEYHITHQGWKVWGSPNVPFLTNWAFYLNVAGFNKLYSNLDKNIDILLTHSPPVGYCDEARDNAHPGLMQSLGYALAYEPLAILCGHIHEARGIQRINDKTMVCNASYMDRNYTYTYAPTYLGYSPQQRRFILL